MVGFFGWLLAFFGLLPKNQAARLQVLLSIIVKLHHIYIFASHLLQVFVFIIIVASLFTKQAFASTCFFQVTGYSPTIATYNILGTEMELEEVK